MFSTYLYNRCLHVVLHFSIRNILLLSGLFRLRFIISLPFPVASKHPASISRVISSYNSSHWQSAEVSGSLILSEPFNHAPRKKDARKRVYQSSIWLTMKSASFFRFNAQVGSDVYNSKKSSAEFVFFLGHQEPTVRCLVRQLSLPPPLLLLLGGWRKKFN